MTNDLLLNLLNFRCLFEIVENRSPRKRNKENKEDKHIKKKREEAKEHQKSKTEKNKWQRKKNLHVTCYKLGKSGLPLALVRNENL